MNSNRVIVILWAIGTMGWLVGCTPVYVAAADPDQAWSMTCTGGCHGEGVFTVQGEEDGAPLGVRVDQATGQWVPEDTDRRGSGDPGIVTGLVSAGTFRADTAGMLVQSRWDSVQLGAAQFSGNAGRVSDVSSDLPAGMRARAVDPFVPREGAYACCLVVHPDGATHCAPMNQPYPYLWEVVHGEWLLYPQRLELSDDVLYHAVPQVWQPNDWIPVQVAP